MEQLFLKISRGLSDLSFRDLIETAQQAFDAEAASLMNDTQATWSSLPTGAWWQAGLWGRANMVISTIAVKFGQIYGEVLGKLFQ